MQQFDVVIAGGAMAGMTLALSLNKLSPTPLSVAVIDPFQTNHQAHPGFDSRSIALSYGTVAILKQVGLWQAISEVATPIEHIHVSDRGHAGMTDITHQQLSVEALGYVVELTDVGAIYRQKAEQDPQITLVDAAVEAIVREQNSVELLLTNGHQIKAKLLVAADGATSTCCQQAGIELHEHDYGQVAVIANITTEQAHLGRAFERFTSSGPVALLPMSQGRMSLVWCLDPHQANAMMQASDTEFTQALQQAFGWRLGAITKVGQRACYPLLLRYRQQAISHRVAVVGNAAQTLHPIAGQGFNLGIRDVATLTEHIAQFADDPGCYQALRQYQQARQTDREATITMTSSLVHLFSNDYLSLRIARNLGLAAMDTLPLLKAPLLQRTLGLVAR
ncbi:2-octaprenyl-6-methoxyphenyl hydroxylase [Vibrio sp. JPW-9-11-11]|uniref:2-octaprenyl-6-methoxyphenyl hydroxylase n=1 Tax=Vibrio sp. JPW-9-11-11 TaxID=1416532 RepID=UPI001592BDF8|nr:2-octaprenyl-6-methoxyphenyl hydroxylase [Vibrio sp. JPW-9-11-11]NVD07507.1 2-octaprenyl-6-methoxyphenyl hydroxylase [Vibrio sp. JPW-9-11-11]